MKAFQNLLWVVEMVGLVGWVSQCRSDFEVCERQVGLRSARHCFTSGKVYNENCVVAYFGCWLDIFHS